MNNDAFLIIEDQKSMSLLLQNELQQLTTLPVHICHTLADAKALLDSDINIVACLSDLTLPDASQGEAVELLQSRHITTVVLTASYSEKTRQAMFKQKVADYVIKDGPSSIRYAVQTAYKLYKNRERRIFILSAGSKEMTKLLGLLRIHRYQVSLFENMTELKQELNTSIPDLILLDSTEFFEEHQIYDLVNDIRQQYSANQLPLMACEISVNISSAIKLMKYGVNDFFNAGFTAEEFYARINQNIEQAESFRHIETISQTDGLTGIYNRRYFFEQGSELYKQLKEQQKYYFAVMADIDHFKLVNDNHGHQKGDEAIIFTSQQINNIFSDFLVARFGGEEFCVFGEVKDASEVENLCEQLRQTIETESEKQTGVKFTISLGLTYSGKSLDDAVSKADQALYRSKESGRNLLSVEF